MISESDIDALLASTNSLFQNIYSFDCTGHSMPGKTHRGAAIAHQDVLERRADFSRELRNTMSAWVYSKKKYQQILSQELIERNQDLQNAVSHINALVAEKFRKGFPQGQFGELLLFNLIQHYFRAVPLLRKMPLTTNPAVERHGADAIHFRPSNTQNIVFIGEAKSYSSSYKFKTALDDAITSILKTFNGISTELGLYVYDDFIDETLQAVARQIKTNTLPNVVYELVCLVSFTETDKKKNGATQNEIEDSIQKVVNEHLTKHQTSYGSLDQVTLGKIHFVILPFWDFDKLLEEFNL